LSFALVFRLGNYFLSILNHFRPPLPKTRALPAIMEVWGQWEVGKAGGSRHVQQPNEKSKPNYRFFSAT
jgi:hypothetical protein